MAKKKNDKNVTVCGALCPTGPGAKYAKNGGGKVYHVRAHGNKVPTLKDKVKSMLIEASKGEI